MITTKGIARRIRKEIARIKREGVEPMFYFRDEGVSFYPHGGKLRSCKQLPTFHHATECLPGEDCYKTNDQQYHKSFTGGYHDMTIVKAIVNHDFIRHFPQLFFDSNEKRWIY